MLKKIPSLLKILIIATFSFFAGAFVMWDYYDSEAGIVFNRRFEPTQPDSWGGIELWEAVNKRRVELGVNELAHVNYLCTIASIRLNELLRLGDLDGHEGLVKLSEKRPDLEWMFDSWHIDEFISTGGDTPERTVEMWESGMGHKRLLEGDEYIWGCTYASNTFAVAIVAY